MASGSRGPESARRVFAGSMLALTVETWDEGEREVVERADSVAIVALDVESKVTLVRQFRAPARRKLLELPAGTVDEGEDPIATARRELEEETGLRGGGWRAGPVFYSTPGFCRERIHLFFAEDVESGKPARDGDERIELVRWTASEAASRLGEIEDAKTLAGLLLYLRERA